MRTGSSLRPYIRINRHFLYIKVHFYIKFIRLVIKPVKYKVCEVSKWIKNKMRKASRWEGKESLEWICEGKRVRCLFCEG